MNIVSMTGLRGRVFQDSNRNQGGDIRLVLCRRLKADCEGEHRNLRFIRVASRPRTKPIACVVNHRWQRRVKEARDTSLMADVA